MADSQSRMPLHDLAPQPATMPPGRGPEELSGSLIVFVVRLAFVAGSWLCASLLLNGAALEPPWRDSQPYVVLGGLCVLNGLLLISRRPVRSSMGSVAGVALGSAPGRTERARPWMQPLWTAVFLLRGIFAVCSWLLAIIMLGCALLLPEVDKRSLVVLTVLSATNAVLLHPRRGGSGQTRRSQSS